jgi:hypothetical protein
MARATYMSLRLGAVGVIAALFISMYVEYRGGQPPHCLQKSISAFYYTPVQFVFVGALCAMGLVMIVLWGKTAWEDGWFNLAGLLAPVVAFVPTSKSNGCGLIVNNQTVADKQARDASQAAADAFQASHAAVHNNMLTYIWVVILALFGIAIFGLIAHIRDWHFVTKNPLAYWGPWVVALVLWGFGTWKFNSDLDQFYLHAHKFAANTMFGFIVAAVVGIGYQKWPRSEAKWAPRWLWNLFFRPVPDNEPKKGWAVFYWILAAVMVLGAGAIFIAAPHVSFRAGEHRTWFVEAWMIAGLAIFWLVQTYDRRDDGAPPRTAAEVVLARAQAVAQAEAAPQAEQAANEEAFAP